ncbi:MAG: RAD55 family ATPase [Candidatus Bathyarchaeia archaeon]
MAENGRFMLESVAPLLRSGLPLGTNVVLLGPPGSGKTSFCESLLCECLRKGIGGLYITLDHSPAELRKRMVGDNSPSTGKPSLEFVDGYSWRTGGSTERFFVANLFNLSDLSVRIFLAANELPGNIFFIFDSVTTLLTYSSEPEVTRFLDVNMARMRRNGNTGIYAVEEGIHTSAFYNSLRHMADAVLEMRIEDDDEIRRYIRVHTFRGLNHSSRWLPYPFTP